VPKMMAGILSMFLSYVPHLLFGDHMDAMTDFIVCTVFGGVVYLGMLWYLLKLRGEW
jgi:hypothetical protein